MWADVALIAGSYLLGSLPQLYFIGRIRGFDLRQERDMHIALWQKVGRAEGIIGILGDFAKGVTPIVVGRGLGFELSVIATAGVAAVAGQMWPIFLRFEGEKGNSIGLAMVATLAPKALILAGVPILLGALSRTVRHLLDSRTQLSERLRFRGAPSLSLPLGMLMGFGLMPFSAWLFREPPAVILAYFVLFLLIVVRRLTARLGDDFKVSSDKKSILINRLLYDRGFR
ncbi:MAG: glycerol-3-phosphate acyltransferase [Chloroflexi bacterium]|nr:glycerol-3-phosphate acyltransferase [Chloroflexota bacterium]